jgi:hypothetical protein
MRVVVDPSVHPEQRESVRETVGAMLAPILKGDPQFADLVALVRYGPGGWDVSVVTLSPVLGLVGRAQGVNADLLGAVHAALRQAHRP